MTTVREIRLLSLSLHINSMAWYKYFFSPKWRYFVEYCQFICYIWHFLLYKWEICMFLSCIHFWLKNSLKLCDQHFGSHGQIVCTIAYFLHIQFNGSCVIGLNRVLKAGTIFLKMSGILIELSDCISNRFICDGLQKTVEINCLIKFCFSQMHNI